MDVLSIIAVLVLIVIVLCSLLLIIPFHLSLELCKEGPSIVGTCWIAFLGITLMRRSLPSSSPVGRVPEQEREDDRDRGEEKAQSRDQMRLPDPRSLLDAFPAIVRVLMDLVGCIKFNKVCGRLSIGLDDPVETAVMSGYLWSALSASGLYRANLFIEPYFGGPRLEGDFRAELQARLLWALVAMLRALGKKKMRRLMMEMARGVRA